MSTSPTPRGATARGDDRRRSILAAGVACLADEGWAGLTHRRVAARAESTLGLVRYHFGDLEGLRREIAREVSGGLAIPLRESLSGASDRADWIDRLLALVAGLDATRDEIALLLQVMVGSLTYPEVAEVVRGDLDSMRDALRDSLVALPDSVPVDRAAEVAAFVLSVVDGLLLGAALDPDTVGGHDRLLRTTVTALLAPP
jgi:AcrR family transcriptional regulator